MTVSDLNVQPGSATYLGAVLDENGCNFAVHCPNADLVQLCLFSSEDEVEIAVIDVPAKTGKVWHCYIEGIQAGQLYGYRTSGGNKEATGFHFMPEKLLIDPYAKKLSRPMFWDAKLYSGDSQKMVAKSVVVANSAWQDRPAKPIRL